MLAVAELADRYVQEMAALDMGPMGLDTLRERMAANAGPGAGG
jgi:hypothetical protein